MRNLKYINTNYSGVMYHNKQHDTAIYYSELNVKVYDYNEIKMLTNMWLWAPFQSN